jgi:lipopolysaccharide export system protein LptC
MTASVPGSPEKVAPGGSPAIADDASPDSKRHGALMDYFAITDRRRSHRHYGRFVGVIKFLLLSLAVGLIAALAIYPRLADKDKMFQVGSSPDVQPEDVASLRVKNARLTGASHNGKPYTVTFETASQTSNESDLVVLSAPQADIELETGAWVALSARQGRFHKSKRIIELDDPVQLFHDSGLEIATGNITFNLGTGTGAGHDPLVAQAPFGQLESQGFRIRENTAVFIFEGPVRAVLYSAPELGG